MSICNGLNNQGCNLGYYQDSDQIFIQSRNQIKKDFSEGAMPKVDSELLITLSDDRVIRIPFDLSSSQTLRREDLILNDENFLRKSKKVVIPEGIKNISRECFMEWRLEEVELPSTLKGIKVKAFANCKNLKKVEIPYGVKFVDYDCFSGCENLKEVKLPTTLKDLRSRAFAGCKGLEKISTLDEVVSIGIECFSGCKSLEEIEFSSNCTMIMHRAFADCKNLKRVILKGANYIYNECFVGCDSLEEIVFPFSARIVGENVFHSYTKLSRL